jgi:hypothetical protein
VGVWRAAFYVYIVSGVSVAPFGALCALHQHLLCAGDDKERFGVIVAVKRDDGAGRNHAAHDAEVIVRVIWRGQEFDCRSEQFQSYVTCSFGDAVMNIAVVSLG